MWIAGINGVIVIYDIFRSMFVSLVRLAYELQVDRFKFTGRTERDLSRRKTKDDRIRIGPSHEPHQYLNG